MNDRDARVALVTSATGFAGPPAVDGLRTAGLRVLVHDKAFGNAQTRSEFSSEHPGVEFVEANDPASVILNAWEMAGRIDALISNDHYPAIQKSSEETSLEELRETLEALVLDPFATLKAAIPYFKAQSDGNVVMITSCRTQLPVAGSAIPDAARAAANALVRSLAVELAPFEIAVNAIAPNFLSSEAYFPRATFIDDPRGKAYVEAAVPAGRLGRPEEIGELVRFLATAKARFLTGAIIDFAGGWPAGLPRPE